MRDRRGDEVGRHPQHLHVEAALRRDRARRVAVARHGGRADRRQIEAPAFQGAGNFPCCLAGAAPGKLVEERQHLRGNACHGHTGHLNRAQHGCAGFQSPEDGGSVQHLEGGRQERALFDEANLAREQAAVKPQRRRIRLRLNLLPADLGLQNQGHWSGKGYRRHGNAGRVEHARGG